MAENVDALMDVLSVLDTISDEEIEDNNTGPFSPLKRVELLKIILPMATAQVEIMNAIVRHQDPDSVTIHLKSASNQIKEAVNAAAKSSRIPGLEDYITKSLATGAADA